MTPPTRCRGCIDESVTLLIDAGLHPVANKFLASADAPEERFSLAMGQCEGCGLIQLIAPVPVEALVPTVDWITYNEPEGHLDAVTETLLGLSGLGPASTIGAITYKDDSTLQRLHRRGVTKNWRIDACIDLGVGPTAGLETIQDRLTGDRVGQLAATYPAADLLLVRHILEHAYDTHGFLSALRSLVKPGGYMVFEVPDCTQVLDTLDYTTIWEEHILYFTPATFHDTLVRAGFQVSRFECHPYPYENSLVAVVRNVPRGPAEFTADVSDEVSRGARFANHFEARRAQTRQFLAQHRARGGRIAVFGAGHLSCMFINVMDVAEEITFVVDDHPFKCGMFMPGSRLPIRPTASLLEENVDLCLSSLSPESEAKVLSKQQPFLSRGGRFASLFQSSRRALTLAG